MSKVIKHDCYKYFLPSQYFLCCIESHGKAGDEQISESQADQEVIVDASKFPVEDNTEDDQKVGEDGHDNDQDQGQGLHYMQSTKIVLLFVQQTKSLVVCWQVLHKHVSPNLFVFS